MHSGKIMLPAECLCFFTLMYIHLEWWVKSKTWCTQKETISDVVTMQRLSSVSCINNRQKKVSSYQFELLSTLATHDANTRNVPTPNSPCWLWAWGVGRTKMKYQQNCYFLFKYSGISKRNIKEYHIWHYKTVPRQSEPEMSTGDYLKSDGL